MEVVLNARRYGYAYARVCAMKSLLLKRGFILSLLRVRSVSEIVEMLERTQYRDVLVEYNKKYHGSKLIEVATTQYLAHVIKKISTFLSGKDRYLYHISLVKWHITNLKVLLDARMRGLKWGEVEDLFMDIGTLPKEKAQEIVEGNTPSAFKAFSSAPIVREIFKLRLSPVYTEKAFMKAEENPDELLKVKEKLDRFQYLLLLREVEKHKELEMLKKVVRKEVNAVNVRIIAKAKTHGKELKAQDFLPGGDVKVSDLLALAQLAPEDFLRRISAIFDIPQPQDYLAMDIALEKYLAKIKRKALHRAPLTLSAIIMFPYLQEEVIHNLRKIAIGKEFNVPPERIKEVLII